MICPGCQRDNHAARRYCGGCGCNFQPACGACGFANESIDRFCGGCGAGLGAGEIQAHTAEARPRTGEIRPRTGEIRPHTKVVTQQIMAAPAVAAGPWPVDELNGLFEPAAPSVEAPDLPEVGIDQDDVDRLFGGAQ